jgi:hypothetical protein
MSDRALLEMPLACGICSADNSEHWVLRDPDSKYLPCLAVTLLDLGAQKVRPCGAYLSFGSIQT